MEKNDKFARNWGRLLKYAVRNEIDFLVTSLYRTTSQQAALFRDGKSRADGVNNKSKHQLGQAGDLVILHDGQPIWDDIPEYAVLGKFWEGTLEGRWGGNFPTFKDIYHFEVSA